MDFSIPDSVVLHYLPEFVQIHIHSVSNAIQKSHPLLHASSLALNCPHYQGLFKRVNSSHQVAKELELQLQHHSFQRIFRTVFL